MVRLSKISLTSLLLIVAASGCKSHEQSGNSEAYVENGSIWAFGSVQLSNLEAPGAVMLKRTGDQSVDTQYSLYGAVQAITGDEPGERDLAYIDWHPTENKLLAYSYQLDYVVRAGAESQIDVYGVLRKPGRSYYARQRVFLGTATFQAGSNLTRMELANGLKLSHIANGVFAGQWALHYPDVKMIVVKPWQTICNRSVTQQPGQNPSQNPSQFDTCRPLPAQHDLCGGDPTKAGCRPRNYPVSNRPPVQDPVDGDQGEDQTADLPVVAPGVEIVVGAVPSYAMDADVKEAKLVFVAEKQAVASDEKNAELCSRKFYAVARTVGRQVNGACVVKPAPVSRRDGKLTCAVTVGFQDARTYLEKVCNVTGLFQIGGEEPQSVQLLKR